MTRARKRRGRGGGVINRTIPRTPSVHPSCLGRARAAPRRRGGLQGGTTGARRTNNRRHRQGVSHTSQKSRWRSVTEGAPEASPSGVGALGSRGPAARPLQPHLSRRQGGVAWGTSRHTQTVTKTSSPRASRGQRPAVHQDCWQPTDKLSCYSIQLEHAHRSPTCEVRNESDARTEVHSCLPMRVSGRSATAKGTHMILSGKIMSLTRLRLPLNLISICSW